jgi:hypothetical protein
MSRGEAAQLPTQRVVVAPLFAGKGRAAAPRPGAAGGAVGRVAQGGLVLALPEPCLVSRPDGDQKGDCEGQGGP